MADRHLNERETLIIYGGIRWEGENENHGASGIVLGHGNLM